MHRTELRRSLIRVQKQVETKTATASIRPRRIAAEGKERDSRIRRSPSAFLLVLGCGFAVLSLVQRLRVEVDYSASILGANLDELLHRNRMIAERFNS